MTEELRHRLFERIRLEGHSANDRLKVEAGMLLEREKVINYLVALNHNQSADRAALLIAIVSDIDKGVHHEECNH